VHSQLAKKLDRRSISGPVAIESGGNIGAADFSGIQPLARLRRRRLTAV
jgi:hypothetical protein